MWPYNEHENDMLSQPNKKIQRDRENGRPLYLALLGVILIALLVLAVATSVKSFMVIGN